MGLLRRIFSKTSTTAQNTSSRDDSDLNDVDSLHAAILANYPKDLAERYQGKSADFLQALVLASQQQDREALDLLAKLPIEEQDDLFDYELGILMARHGHEQKACNTMRSCLQQNPDHLMAAEALVMLLVKLEQSDQALELILQMLLEERDSTFCHAQLASLYHIRQDDRLALKHSLEAISAGHDDPNITLLAATLLEQDNKFDRAEKLYSRILDGSEAQIGLYHAEFLLRRKRDLNKVLDTFTTASQHEPENPRWQLRIAQTQIAQGSKRKGQQLLREALANETLAETLRNEGNSLLDKL